MMNRSSPLPPISRMEDNGQVKRCARLRRTLRRGLDTMFAPYYQAYEELRPHAVVNDLEKYFDIYEISRIDLQDAEIIATAELSETQNADTLQDLKNGLQKLHVIRRIFLCTLLALNADGGKADFQRWSATSEAMGALSSVVASVVLDMDGVLSEEEGKSQLSFRRTRLPVMINILILTSRVSQSSNTKGAFDAK